MSCSPSGATGSSPRRGPWTDSTPPSPVARWTARIRKIDLEEALRAYTLDAAFAAFQEDLKGTLEPGKLADIVVLDRDLFAMDPVDLPDARVLATVVGGRVVHGGRR